MSGAAHAIERAVSGIVGGVRDAVGDVVGAFIPQPQVVVNAPAPAPAAPIAPTPAPQAPAAAPTATAAAPTTADQETAREAAASDEVRRRALSGRASTILTSQTGTSSANLSSRTLLGS